MDLLTEHLWLKKVTQSVIAINHMCWKELLQ